MTKYNFINIVENFEASFPIFFEILSKFLTNQKLLGVCFHPLHTISYNTAMHTRGFGG